MHLLRALQLEILVSQGQRQYARCLLLPGEYRLGHSRGNEITIDEPSVSDRHARLTLLESGGVYIQDVGSANGTYVDNEFADSPLYVALGAHFQLGACDVVLRATAAG